MYLYGASGHGKVVLEIAEANDIVIKGFIDEDHTKQSLAGYAVFHEIPDQPCDLIVSVGNNSIRKEIVECNKNHRYIKLIHPRAVISKRAQIEEGTVIMAGVTINSEVKVGKHCIVNTNSSIDHDCSIGDFTHISPNAALGGNVIVGQGTHIGIGANIIQGITIGNWCTIGAGAVIIKDVPDGATVVGNPGKIIKYHSSK